MPNTIRSFLILAVVVLLEVRVEASGLYTITDLGTLPGTSQSTATAINDLGQVVGYSSNSLADTPQAFLYSNGQMTSISPIGGGIPHAINDSGVVVGGQYTAINNSGQYVGWTSGNNGNGVLISGGTTTSLGNFRPEAINDSGVIVGEVENSNSMLPAIYKDGHVINLAQTLGLNTLSGQALAIDRAGDVLFYYLDLKNNDVPVYLVLKSNGQLLGSSTTAGGDPTTLGVLSSINSSLQLVGENALTQSGKFSQLGNLLSSTAAGSWEFLDANMINESGQIVGTGDLSNGGQHAFLMTPVQTPEPSSFLVLGTGLVFVASWASFRGARNCKPKI